MVFPRLLFSSQVQRRLGIGELSNGTRLARQGKAFIPVSPHSPPPPALGKGQERNAKQKKQALVLKSLLSLLAGGRGELRTICSPRPGQAGISQQTSGCHGKGSAIKART